MPFHICSELRSKARLGSRHIPISPPNLGTDDPSRHRQVPPNLNESGTISLSPTYHQVPARAAEEVHYDNAIEQPSSHMTAGKVIVSLS